MVIEGDSKAAIRVYAAASLAGVCSNFDKGDQVFVAEGGFTAMKVRRKGETEAYWLPIENKEHRERPENIERH